MAWPELTEQQRETLLGIIARAAPPSERTRGEYFSPRPGPARARLEQLSLQWRKAVVDDVPEQMMAYLRARGLDAAAFERGLSEVSIRDPEVLPGWAQALVALLRASASGPAGAPGGRPVDILEPLLGGADRFLSGQLVAAGLATTASANAGMLAVLANRFRLIIGPLWEYELRLAASTAGLFGASSAAPRSPVEPSVAGWLDWFDRFPGLAYLIGVAYANWRGFIIEFSERLATDRALLRERLFGGKEPGAVTGFRGDAGDVHGHGRAVALLTFEQGRRVAYKPKDLRCAGAFMDLIASLNAAGLEPQLHVRQILTRGNYTWEEFIEHQPCQDAREVERFYLRMGMMIRLLQLLEGRDFWLDNLVAHGEHPVFIDLETLLQPRLVSSTGLLPSEREARRQLAESAVETCALSMPTPIDVGISAEELGALAAPRTFLSPFKRNPAATGRPGGRPPAEEDYITWTHPEHAPILEGTPVSAAHHLEAIVTGYRRMQECLRAQRTALLEPEGPLRGLRDAPVRFIYRDTWSCQKLVRRSVAPPLLADPIQREIFLQQLLRPVFTQQPDGRLGAHHAGVILSEQEALRELDVPLFTSRPDHDVIFTQEGAHVTGHFEGTAWERLRERLLQLETFPLEQQLDLVRSCFSVVHPATGSASSASAPVRPLSVGTAQLVEEAVGMGTVILADAVTGSEDDLSWLGFVYHPYIDLLSLSVLQSDQLTGSAGLAILFTDLYSATGEERWRRAAHGALTATLEEVEEAPATFRDLERSNRPRSVPPYCGAFLGTGAHLFCLSYCARVLDAPGLNRAASGGLTGLPVEALMALAGTDVVSGTAGLMLSLLAMAGEDGRAPEHQLAAGLAMRLLDARGAEGRLAPPLYPRRARRLSGMPDATAGLALGLASLTKFEGADPRFRRELDVLFHQGLRRQEGAPHDPGRLLVRLEIARSVGENLGGTLGEIDEFLSAAASVADMASPLDALEVATMAFEVSGEPKYHAHALGLAGRLRAFREVSGSWFPGTVAADRHHLSIVWGVPAIARAFLRLHNPAKVPSLRLLRLPRLVGAAA